MVVAEEEEEEEEEHGLLGWHTLLSFKTQNQNLIHNHSLDGVVSAPLIHL